MDDALRQLDWSLFAGILAVAEEGRYQRPPAGSVQANPRLAVRSKRWKKCFQRLFSVGMRVGLT